MEFDKDRYWVIGENAWNKKFYTEEKAKKAAETLINCKGCVNCTCCSDCTECISCENCEGCFDCEECEDCVECSICRDSINAVRCEECAECKNITDCKICLRILDCKDSYRLEQCSGCKGCKECGNCSDCTDCENSMWCVECEGCMQCTFCEARTDLRKIDGNDIEDVEWNDRRIVVSRSWLVFGAEGHRQKISFGDSFHHDFSEGKNVRILDCKCEDMTGTNEYVLLRITRNTAAECEDELDGQISDGIFENARVGDVKEVTGREKRYLLDSDRAYSL